MRRPQSHGVKGLVFYNQQILLVRPSYGHRKWTIPGGGLKRNEEPALACVRELKEETGVSIGSPTYFGTFSRSVEYRFDTVECYYANVDRDVVSVDNFEIVEAGWFTVSELPENRAESVDLVLTLYENRNS